MSQLFEPLKIRDITFKNRIFVSPMCQYSSENGMPTDWHFVHLGTRAVGGAALVLVEATGVCPEGRISPQDSGLWTKRHAEAFKKITRFIKEQGAVPGIQLAHAGRKASTAAPWDGGKEVPAAKGGWTPLAPTTQPFSEGYPHAKLMSSEDIAEVVGKFRGATRLAIEAGFEVVELHFAHGYLVQEFLSPLVNHREDAYGGNLENRMRLGLEIAEGVRKEWPQGLPLFVRISSVDWMDGGWSLEDSVVFAKRLKTIANVDLIDCSSGGAVPGAKIPVGPGYQVPFAAEIRKQAKIATGAVGMITDPKQAEEIVASGQADAVLLARQMLRDPYWPLHAAKALGADVPWPKQYQRAKD